ncbi:MAG: hypothetical protein IT163_07465 [Bryobacterales bacterium]|nr:hypothetical protein [Bryobacterales bacterium]
MMRYWGILVAKLAGIGLVMALAWMGLHALWPEPETVRRFNLQPFGTDLGYTMAILGLWLLAVGLVYLAVLDQRYRCRTCGRRLHMPVSSGAWNSLLLRSPRTDYICRYGHGTLRVSDVELVGMSRTDWHAVDDMWKELEELEIMDK